jgi:hypothetical protein
MLGMRLGRMVPLALGLGAYGCSVVVLVHVPTPAGFIGANLALGIAFFFVVPYLMGTLAVLDPTGRLTVAGAAFGSLGAAFGPASAGLLFQQGAGWLTLFAVGTILLSIGALAPAIRLADRSPARGT